jgi:hypothetical protein
MHHQEWEKVDNLKPQQSRAKKENKGEKERREGLGFLG